MNRTTTINVIYAILAVLGLLAVQGYIEWSQEVERVPYSTFKEYLEDERVDDLRVTESEITGAFVDPDEGDPTHFVTARVEPDFARQLEEQGIEFTGGSDESAIGTIASWVLPVLLFFALWFFVVTRLANRMSGAGMMQIGKSKAKIYVEQDTGTGFKDVAGVDEAKTEVQEVVDFLKEPERFARLGAKLPRGVLLVGPPGTGKTLLAKAVAGEAGVAFLSISGSEFIEMVVGVGAARVRDLFTQAKEHAPCIIFIDELDALARARGTGQMQGGHDEREQTLNQLLGEMDGFDSGQGIILLAATNRPETLDPAILRPGRFDRQVLVDRPDKKGRAHILEVHTAHIRLDPEVDLEQVATITPGFTGADLANLANEAALLATRRGRTAVTTEDFNNAIERIVAGLEKRNRVLNEKERRVVAYHELGHAVVANSLTGVDRVQKVSIIPRGIGALGYTLQRPTEDRFLMSEQELKNKMCVLLAGRAAESVFFEEISTGASDDLQRVTEIARAMVTRYGMERGLGQAAYESETGNFLGTPAEGGGRRYGEETAREIDVAVRGLIDEAFQRAKAIVADRRDEIDQLAHKLLDQEVLEADELPTPEPEREAA
ncbi:MAG: ATP-dependent zinc metalloprotease FtsH [Alphaproteobacteria bacterium]